MAALFRDSSTGASAKVDLGELDIQELEAVLVEEGYQPFHARQTYRWIHKRGVTNPDEMTDLPLALRSRLQTAFHISTPRVLHDDGDKSLLVKANIFHL